MLKQSSVGHCHIWPINREFEFPVNQHLFHEEMEFHFPLVEQILAGCDWQASPKASHTCSGLLPEFLVFAAAPAHENARTLGGSHKV